MTSKILLKSANVKGTNVLVQIPKFILKSWDLVEHDFIDMELSEEGKLILTPRKCEVSDG